MAKKVRRTTRKTNQPSGISSYIIPIVVGVVMVALVIGAIVLNEKRSSGAAAVRPEDISVPVVTVGPQPTQSIPYPGVPRVTLKETQSLLEKGQAVLIDVRDSSAYDQSHAVGALLFPESEIETRLSELPRDKKLILYCTWGQEQASARVAQMLMDKGFTDVGALLGGFAAWQRAGFAVETSGGTPVP